MFEDIIKKPKQVNPKDTIICCVTCGHGNNGGHNCMINSTHTCWNSGKPMKYKNFHRFNLNAMYSKWIPKNV